MKLLPTTSLPFTEDLNIGLILNDECQMYRGRECLNSKHALLDIFENVDAGYTNWNLANKYSSVQDLISNFHYQPIARLSNYFLSPWHAFSKWADRSNQITKNSWGKMNIDSLELSKFFEQKDGNNLSCLQQVARFISGTRAW